MRPFARQLLELLLELGVGEAVTSGDDVAGQEARAEERDLRQPALAGAPEELELDHPVLRRGVALGEAERSQLRGLAADAGRDEDVRDAPLVSRDRRRVAAWVGPTTPASRRRLPGQ